MLMSEKPPGKLQATTQHVIQLWLMTPCSTAHIGILFYNILQQILVEKYWTKTVSLCFCIHRAITVADKELSGEGLQECIQQWNGHWQQKRNKYINKIPGLQECIQQQYGHWQKCVPMKRCTKGCAAKSSDGKQQFVNLFPVKRKNRNSEKELLEPIHKLH